MHTNNIVANLIVPPFDRLSIIRFIIHLTITLYRKKLFSQALKVLNPREREIVELRKLRDKPKKLEELSQKYKISRERVRQIEEKAIQKLQKEISNTI